MPHMPHPWPHELGWVACTDARPKTDSATPCVLQTPPEELCCPDGTSCKKIIPIPFIPDSMKMCIPDFGMKKKGKGPGGPDEVALEVALRKAPTCLSATLALFPSRHGA